MPNPEFSMWKAFYLIEPWGFENTEFLVSQILAMVHNVNQSKKSKMRKPKVFMRNMSRLVLNAISRERVEIEREDTYDEIDTETQHGKEEARQAAVRSLKNMFGARVIDTKENK